MIALAVLKDPTILILDEATSALDTESEHPAEVGTTHEVSYNADYRARLYQQGADRVIGKRYHSESGTYDELMRQQSTYRRLVERQFTAV